MQRTLQNIKIELSNDAHPMNPEFAFSAIYKDTVLFTSSYNYDTNEMTISKIDPAINEAFLHEKAFNVQHLVALCIEEAARQSNELCL